MLSQQANVSISSDFYPKLLKEFLDNSGKVFSVIKLPIKLADWFPAVFLLTNSEYVTKTC